MTEEIMLDAFVVGAGVGGIYATYRLSQMGFDVKCIDIAGDVGGTWYWNTYPGAMSDTESYLYRYSWDKEDLQNYPWTHHYLYQPEILEYLRHVVDKYSLRKYMKFKLEMTSAKWNDNINRWRIFCSTGEVFLARYLINALGVLSKPNYPDIPGLDCFGGQVLHTAKWDNSVKLDNKKVGVIGNGSTGIQVMTAIAPIVAELKSFQRHPQYSVPSGQGLVSSEYREHINTNYDTIWNKVWSSAVGFGVPESTRKTMEATRAEREKAFQEAWNSGNGFRFMFSAFGDITTDESANEEACEFIRGKIDSIVKDPHKASILKPRELYIRRPLCDSGYYDIFNQNNVDVIDLQVTSISRMVSQGLQLSDGTIHNLDILIFATGFDAIEGNYLRINIVGRDGKTIQEHWKNGPTAYGGIACAGFPNMFLVSGPQAPFANFPPVIESEIDFVMSCIESAENTIHNWKDLQIPRPAEVIEATRKAETEWSALCDQLVEKTLFKRTDSWIFGSNVVGRKATTNFYFGGLHQYREWIKDVITDDFRGFKRSMVSK